MDVFFLSFGNAFTLCMHNPNLHSVAVHAHSTLFVVYFNCSKCFCPYQSRPVPSSQCSPTPPSTFAQTPSHILFAIPFYSIGTYTSIIKCVVNCELNVSESMRHSIRWLYCILFECIWSNNKKKTNSTRWINKTILNWDWNETYLNKKQQQKMREKKNQQTRE